ncbi:EexN family lipoprotein [Paremcibacter congregatus]|uniref:EexN family lipoprotein n=1 Tax=Paremcibacter congregatus TaxID=2043170 RepID=UPI003A8C9772
MKKSALILIATTVLSSCGEPKIESKLFYKDNDQTRKDTLAWCAERPDQITSNGNCVNAQAALAEKIQELKQARIAEREKRWDTRFSIVIVKERCGTYQNSEAYTSCSLQVNNEIDKKHEEMAAFNAETDTLIDALQ